MQTKNTLKFIVILVAVGFFGSMFVSGVSAQAQLSAPTPLLAQAGAASGSKAGASLSNPIIVDTTMPVLQISPPPSPGSFYYRFFIYRITGSTVASTPFFQEPLPVSQSLSYRVPPNVLSFGNSYAWTAVTCSDSKCTQASTYSAYSYIKVAAKVAPAPVVAPAGPLPIFFATEANGTVLKFDGANWVRISGPAAEPAPVVSPAPAEAPRGFWTAVGKFFNNLWDRIVQFFGGKTTPTVQSTTSNLEVVRKGPGAQNIQVTVSPAIPTLTPSTQSNSCGTDCYTQVTQVTSSPADQPTVNISVSNVPANYGNFSVNVYNRDLNPATHGQFHNYILSYQSTCKYYSGSSATCDIRIPTETVAATSTSASNADLEVWIEPTSCGQDGALGLFNNPTGVASIVSTNPASSTLGPTTISAQASIPSGISYDVQLGWNQNQLWPQGAPTYFSCSNTTCGTINSGNSSLTLSSTVPTISPFYAGVKIQKNIQGYSFAPVGSAQPTYSTCHAAFWGTSGQGTPNPDSPITPTGETTGGSITIVKVTQNSSGNTIQSSQAFSFTSNTVAPAIPAFTLNTASNPSKNFSPRPAGPYTFTEIVPAGWQNVSATCTGTGFNVNTNFTPPSVGFTMYTGGNVTCTFTNKQTVKKATAVIVNPPPPPPPPVLTCNTVQYTSNVYAVTVGNQTYSVQWQPTPAEVNVASASTASLGLAVTGPSSVAGDNDTVSNNQVTLQSSPISFPGSYNAVLTITPSVVQAGAPPRCQLSKTYTVSQPPPTNGTIIINKVVQQGDVGGIYSSQSYVSSTYDFNFTSALAPTSFTLDADSSSTVPGSQQTFNNVSAGTYNFSEASATPALTGSYGWGSTVNCVKTSGTGNSTGTVSTSPSFLPLNFSVNLAANDTVTCTVTNSVRYVGN